MSATPRPPNLLESAIFERLLSVTFPGDQELRAALSDVRVRNIDELGSLELIVTSGPSIPAIKRIPVEGEVVDADGIMIHVLIHVARGKPCELEIYKEDGSVVLDQSRLAHLEVYVLPPSPDEIEGTRH